MKRDIDPTEILNTYNEWHYFLGGIAIGFICGTLIGIGLVILTIIALRGL